MARTKRDGISPLGRWIRPVKRFAIYARDGYKCGYCLKDLRVVKREVDRQLDHLDGRAIRFTDGGQAVRNNHQSNLITACAACNAAKADIAFTVFVKRFAGAEARIARLVKLPLDLVAARIVLGLPPVRGYAQA